MTEIIFAKTRHVYDSYLDFWSLAELSGFPIIYVDEIRLDSPGVYITAPMNGDYRAHIGNEINRIKEERFSFVQAHLILWNIERPSGSAGSVAEYARSNRQLMYDRLVDEVWVSDVRLADETTLRYVVMGSDYGLGELGNTKQYDFVHLSAELPRRQTIYKYFDRQTIGPNCWPPERDNVLKQSKFALNVHQDSHPFMEPLRFSLYAAYGLPIVSETCFDTFPYINGNNIITMAYDEIVPGLKRILTEGNYAGFREMGMRTREMMCDKYQFGKVVRQAVKESVGEWR
jgi:hypothetical protein